MDAEPVTPDASLIFRSGGCPPVFRSMHIRAKAPFRFTDRTHPWPIRAHPASLSKVLPLPASPPCPRRDPKPQVRWCHRDVPLCVDHPKAFFTSRFINSGNLAGESLVRSATDALAKTCRSLFPQMRHLANEAHHQTTVTTATIPFPPGRLASHQSSEDDQCDADIPAAPGIPDPVSRVRHPSTATNLHRGERSRRTMSACWLPHLANPALRPDPRSSFPFPPLPDAPAGTIWKCPHPRRTKTRTRRNTRQHANTCRHMFGRRPTIGQRAMSGTRQFSVQNL